MSATVVRFLAGAMALLATAGCRSPQGRIDRMVSQAQLRREVVTGAGFDHVLYRPARPAAGLRLDVYIEGDGSPYRGRFIVASDPTPHQPLMLELMQHDSAPTLYLGRPCYLGLARDGACSPRYWTLGRFSPEVVASLAEVLRAEIRRTGVQHLTLLGHSGGATLALLLAQRLPQVDRVITIAGNLDPTAWTRLHRYQPLTGSLDPVDETSTRSDLVLVHYAGADDRNIPPDLIRTAAQRLGGAVIVVPGFSHTCCWTRLWPEILAAAR